MDEVTIGSDGDRLETLLIFSDSQFSLFFSVAVHNASVRSTAFQQIGGVREDPVEQRQAFGGWREVFGLQRWGNPENRCGGNGGRLNVRTGKVASETLENGMGKDVFGSLWQWGGLDFFAASLVHESTDSWLATRERFVRGGHRATFA